MKIFVIAGNREQANEWIKSNLIKRHNEGETDISWSDYVIVKDATSLRGYRDPHGVFIGTWRDRSNIIEIVELLLISSMSVNTELHRIHKELQKPKLNGINVIIDEYEKII